MMLRPLVALALCLASVSLLPAADDVKALVAKKVEAEYPSLFELFKDLHQHPELSFTEVRTAGIVAQELRSLGFDVTEKVGGYGVVAVMKNGAGPTVLVRADMDALPVKELTGLPYASTAVVKDLAGKEQPAMHACGHDAHVTCLIGTARVLVSLKDRWSGTLIMVGQPAEEIVGGARAMLVDGLYTRFPVPNYAIALHVSGDLPAGEIGYIEGPIYANVDALDILVRGIGGHGARPQSTRDPIVLAAEIVTMLQTIVSRELKPGTPAVVTVGTIHGGTRRNIIGEEVKLELTLRCFNEAVGDHLIASIRRMCENLGRAAGLPDDRLPVVTQPVPRNAVTSNDPVLTHRLGGVFRDWFPAGRVKPCEPATYGEDFTEYGRTTHHVPICIYWVGAIDPALITAAESSGQPAPSNHSPNFAVIPEPTLKTAVTSLSAAALDLLAKK
jgi:hippurate hydrolase